MPDRPQPQPGDTIIGLSPGELAAVEERREASGNPAEVIDAFTDAPESLAGGITIAQVSLGHFLLLEKIEHPMADPRSESSPEDSMTNTDLLAAIFVVSRPAKESRALLKQGRATFDEAVDTFADGIPFSGLPKLVAAVTRAMRAAFATIIPDEKKTVTESPANPPASVGG